MKRAHVLALVAVLTASAADADEMKVDPKAYNYFTDGKGHYLAGRSASNTSLRDGSLFYARGKGPFYAQTVFRNAWNKKDLSSWSFWSPQASSVRVTQGRLPIESHGELSFDVKRGRWFVRCGVRKTPVFEVSGRDRAALERRKFLTPLHTREVYFGARDDTGQYVLVDNRVRSAGGGGYRLFMGRSGAMKKLRVTEAIRDEIGDVFLTPTGRLVRNKQKNTLFWHPKGRGQEPVEFFQLAGTLNDYLFYGSLGVYTGRLGTPCDDL